MKLLIIVYLAGFLSPIALMALLFLWDRITRPAMDRQKLFGEAPNEDKVTREIPEIKLLCHICALKTGNRWAFNQLIYKVRGEHKCEHCGGMFLAGNE